MHQELDKSFGNLMGTHWKQQKKKKIPLSKSKRRKLSIFKCMLNIFIGHMNFLKTLFVIIFNIA